MKPKQIIFLLITIVALAAAGVFGYFVLTDTTAQVSTTETTTLEILPQGTDLNFGDVNDFNKTGKLFRYPVVAPSEIKVELNDLMQPAPVANQ